MHEGYQQERQADGKGYEDDATPIARPGDAGFLETVLACASPNIPVSRRCIVASTSDKAHLPVQRRVARLQAVGEDAERLGRKHLEIPEESIVHILAVLEHDPVGGPRHPLDAILEAVRHEDSISVNF